MQRWELVGGGSAKFREAGGPAPGTGFPDEDGFVPPEAWREHVLPRRRGGAPVPLPATWPRVDAAEAAATEARQVAEQHGAIEQVLTSPGSDPGAVAAARAYLDGEPDPVGLAVVAATVRERKDADRAEREFAGWTARFGLSLAVRTALVSLGVDTSQLHASYGRRARVTVHDDSGTEFDLQVLAAARRALAAAPEPEYAAVVAELAGLRDTLVRRAATAFLVPERAEWVDECLAEMFGHSRETSGLLRALLLPALGSAEQAQRFGAADRGAWTYWTRQVVATLTDGVGRAAAPLVAGALEQRRWDDDWTRGCAEYVAEFPTDEAMVELVDRIADKTFRLVLLTMVERFPVRSVRVLSAAARRGGADAAAVRYLLDRQVALLRPRLPEILPTLDEESAAYVRGLAGAREPLPEAAPERLPALLVDPPWTRRRTVRKPRVLTGQVADQEVQLLWEEGESAAFAATPYRSWEYSANIGWAEKVRNSDENGWTDQCCRLLAIAPAELMAPYLESWDPRELATCGEQLAPVLARFGTAALRLVLGAAVARPAQVAPVLLPVRGAVAAGVMADALLRLKSVQAVARSWFERHGVAGALLLVPAAVGKAGRARAAAEHALRLVAAQQGAEVLTAAVAERYGEQAAAVVADALGSDPLEAALPAKLPELPSWLRPEALPQIQLADGSGALPLKSVHHLLTVLQLGKLRDPYPGLAPLLREWPGQNAHQRAVEGLDVLAAIGTDAALLQLQGIAQRVKFKALKVRAQEKIAEIAEALGLTGEQLGDRLVPDLGLDPDGTTVIDYGARTFTVGFDEEWRPYVLDADGKRRKDLPAPGARDDQALAPAERRRFAALKKDARTLAADQTVRLEAAMVAERTWTTDEFTDLLVAHPLLGHLVRRLVWTADHTAFRVAEDRTFADVHDQSFALPRDATVRLVHPLRLAPAELAAWAELFADYEIVQPFPQLGRPVAALTAEEAAGHRLHRFEKHTVPTSRILGLTKRGWRRGEPQDAGLEWWFHKPLPNGRHLVVEIRPGIAVGLPNEYDEQALEAVWLDDALGRYWPNSRDYRQRLGDLGPVAVSELLADLQELTAE
ncbi:DUF4132 domain-containing protein [Kitasatospora phosalacinea]|uniref:DUF4132 domain-containing protein n=1 Tax=Kitasatospora phosalacinea TaxID=2065 RepID=UPI00068DE125|nr:DUF4132 domain-containing protein [Kitasatospora phosalacinea]